MQILYSYGVLYEDDGAMHDKWQRANTKMQELVGRKVHACMHTRSVYVPACITCMHGCVYCVKMMVQFMTNDCAQTQKFKN
jgi:hypothetical protein